MSKRTTIRVAAAATMTLGVTSGLLVSGVGEANEPQKEGPATLQDFAAASAPQWNFARANSNDPCWPEDPFNGDGTPKPGGDVKNWPDSDGGCAPHGEYFPTFYTVKKCNPDEIRVSYSIYQATSGFEPSGHPHDFEHIDVVWNKNGDDWTRSKLLMSKHGGHRSTDWDDAESWSADGSGAGLGREYPRIFVGFGSHAMFNDQKEGLKDVASAYTDKEYRQADYPSWSGEEGRLVEVAPDGDLYKKFKDEADAFGKADSNPAKVADEMCEHA
ncbi:hypothetical protein [Streptomyces sp. NPDC048172]|uniref:hypothetical protein n=1 Tax=Streptomyces sp. NPDC048172 TaxID=3365505 RepID=UPI00370F88EE